MMQIIIVAAIGKNYALGNNKALLWNLPGDLPRFKTMTSGYPIIMGRKTFESIGKALPNRTNIVLSSNTQYTATDINPTHTIDSALQLANNTHKEKVFIIGGGDIYRLFLPHANTLELTEVDDAPEADTFFPIFDTTNFDLIKRIKNTQHDPKFDYVTYQRVKANERR